MLQSQLFTKAKRKAPKDEVSKNAELLIRAGYLHKEMAGVYDFLPLGLRVLDRIIQIIREEMKVIGGQELQLTALQNPEIWRKTDRWSDHKVDTWFKTKLKNKSELGLGFTHEEPLSALMREHIQSYRDLPIYVYQFQTKFRNETRAKSGILRTREFLMKDLYSFCRNEQELDEYYEKVKEAYKKIFDRVGIGKKTFLTFASGGVFSKYSHEFQTLCEAGEDVIYCSVKKGIAINKEVLTDEVLTDLNLRRKDLEEKRAIEVGNIFKLGTRFSEPLGLIYRDEKGENRPVVMGSYGLGPARVMGTIAELFSDKKGLVWPKEVAPFVLHLLLLGDGPEIKKATSSFESELEKFGLPVKEEVLVDDRDLSAGEKFAEADLLGLPYRVVISAKTVAKNKVEIKERTGGEARLVTAAELIKIVKAQ